MKEEMTYFKTIRLTLKELLPFTDKSKQIICNHLGKDGIFIPLDEAKITTNFLGKDYILNENYVEDENTYLISITK